MWIGILLLLLLVISGWLGWRLTVPFGDDGWLPAQEGFLRKLTLPFGWGR